MLLINSKDTFIKYYQYVITILTTNSIRMIMQLRTNGKIMRMLK